MKLYPRESLANSAVNRRRRECLGALRQREVLTDPRVVVIRVQIAFARVADQRQQ